MVALPSSWSGEWTCARSHGANPDLRDAGGSPPSSFTSPSPVRLGLEREWMDGGQVREGAEWPTFFFF